MNIRKIVDCQFMLNGAEKDVKAIVKKICDVSKCEEVASFNIWER